MSITVTLAYTTSTKTGKTFGYAVTPWGIVRVWAEGPLKPGQYKADLQLRPDGTYAVTLKDYVTG